MKARFYSPVEGKKAFEPQQMAGREPDEAAPGKNAPHDGKAAKGFKCREN